MTGLSADYHKAWTQDAEPELRRIVRERDETIRGLTQRIEQLEARVLELTGESVGLVIRPAPVVAFGKRGKA